jgi:membrane associated rhomboid family serine protease
MGPALLLRVVAGGLVAACAFGCACRLYLRLRRTGSSRFPVASVALIGVTALITSLQFVFPEILEGLRRNGQALRSGEWWRLVTPLFVQADGWVQCVVNGIGGLILLPLGEKLYGKKLLALYFIPGVVGEIVAYTRHSNGAGSSLSICGVVGGIFTFAWADRSEQLRFTVVLAIAGLCAAAVLSFGDLHGPPILAGAILAGVMRQKNSTRIGFRSPPQDGCSK